MTSAATHPLDDLCAQPLAINGGPRCVPEDNDYADMFRWPIVTKEDEEAVLAALNSGNMSGRDITVQFEHEWAQYNNTKYALTYPNGTLALQVALWAAGVRRGDEVICPSITYWASATPSWTLGASTVFADVDPMTLNLTAETIEAAITPKTKAIMVVHYCAYPAPMDEIMAVAKKHNLLVVEDVSHAQGGLYKGKMLGTFGDVSAMSMMAGKSFAIGEGGMLVTDNEDIYKAAIAYAHYSRHAELAGTKWESMAGVPLGGVKGRLVQTCAAMGRVQLKHYPQRILAIQKAIHRFWDLLEGTPGLTAHRVAPDSDSTMAGWYTPTGLYDAEALGGLSVDNFTEAVRAEGVHTNAGVNFPLHTHANFKTTDTYGTGRPTNQAYVDRDIAADTGSLPVAEAARHRTFKPPYFKHDRPDIIGQYAAAFRKVALQADQIKG